MPEVLARLGDVKAETQEMLGRWIEERIDVLGLSRGQVAAKSEMTADGLRLIIQGKSRPRAKTLQALAPVLQTDYPTLRSVRDGKWVSSEATQSTQAAEAHMIARLRSVAIARGISVESLADQVIRLLDVMDAPPRAH